MSQENHYRRVFAAGAALLLAAALLAGCGYNLETRPQIDAVRVERIKNNTNEPGLQDTLYDALAIELGKYGIRLDPGATYQMDGSLDSITVQNLASREGLAVHFEVNVSGKFWLLGLGGKRIPLRNKNTYIVTFTAIGPLENLTAQREQAIKLAMRDLATELAASVVYGK